MSGICDPPDTIVPDDRVIAQIAAGVVGNAFSPVLFALCTDNTLWRIRPGTNRWLLVPPIPGGDVPDPTP